MPWTKDLLPDLEEIIRNIQFIAFDFDGVFTDNMVYIFEDGREAVKCSRFEGLGLQQLKKTGVGVIVLSTEENPVVTARCKKLGIDCIQGCADKFEILNDFAERAGIKLDKIAFMGNDINDIPCLEKVGLPIVVNDAHPDVLRYARIRTNRNGGNGAVREMCDLISSVKNEKHRMIGGCDGDGAENKPV